MRTNNWIRGRRVTTTDTLKGGGVDGEVVERDAASWRCKKSIFVNICAVSSIGTPRVDLSTE